jgi:hypothetical protein
MKAAMVWLGLLEESPEELIEERSPGRILVASSADGRLVTDELLAGGPVVVDLGDASDDVARSVLDFTLGSAYALDATVERTADRLYVVSRAKAIE